MKKQHKKIWFDHLLPWYLEEGEDHAVTQKRFDLNVLFLEISKASLSETRKQIKDDEYLLHICKFDPDLKMWELQILRLREKDMPGIYDEEADTYQIITLEGEKHIAESTTMLYSVKKGVLFLQRNRAGISPTNLGFYLAELSGMTTATVAFRPETIGRGIDKIKDDNSYKKLTLMVGEGSQGQAKQTTLGRAISQFQNVYGGDVIKIEIGNGHNHRKLLKGKQIADLVREAYYAPETQNLKVRTSLPDDVQFETIDLLDDRAHSMIEMEYTIQDPLTHEKLVDRFIKTCREALG